MSDNSQLDDLMAILAELKSLNRTARALASHLMDGTEAPLDRTGVSPPRLTTGQALPVLSDEPPQRDPEADDLPQRLPKPLDRHIREMALERREQLLGDLERAWKGK